MEPAPVTIWLVVLVMLTLVKDPAAGVVPPIAPGVVKAVAMSAEAMAALVKA